MPEGCGAIISSYDYYDLLQVDRPEVKRRMWKGERHFNAPFSDISDTRTDNYDIIIPPNIKVENFK